MEHWLAQVVSLKNKRGGGIASSHYGSRMKGPPTSVSEDRVSYNSLAVTIRVAVFSHGTSRGERGEAYALILLVIGR